MLVLYCQVTGLQERAAHERAAHDAAMTAEREKATAALQECDALRRALDDAQAKTKAATAAATQV